MKSYKPISCSFYTRLEQLAITGKTVLVEYLEEEQVKRLQDVVIADIFMRAKVEYLHLTNGTEIRLDTLLSVNGIPLRRHC